MKLFTISLLALFISINSFAQIKKLGKVKKNEFDIINQDKYDNDNAIVLFKNRTTYYEYDQLSGWRLITKVHERRLLKNKEGFAYATKSVKYYSGDKRDERVNIKAYTFSLVDNKIVKTKLKKDNIYNQQTSRHWYQKKFTMPNLTEGCIVDWEYKISSPYYSYIDEIIYKIDIPILYMEAYISIPEYFNYKYTTTIYYPVNVTTEKGIMNVQISNKNRNVPVRGAASTKYSVSNVDVPLNNYSLKLKDVEPIAIEPFMNSIINYIGMVKFELSYVKFPHEMLKRYSTTWEDVCKTIYFKSNFGGEIEKHQYFDSDLNALTQTDDNDELKLSKILNFVKSNVRWDNEYGIFADDGVAKAYKKGVGNVAEINFILISMLNKAGLEAYPVLASTNKHGTPLFPTIDGFNYIITSVQLGESTILIDPTERFAPPGVLPKRILNWQGRLVKKDGSSNVVELFPNIYSISKKRVNALINEDNEVKGIDTELFAQNLALSLRKECENKTNDDLIKKFENKYDNISVDGVRMSNLDNLNNPLRFIVQFTMEEEVEEIDNKLVFSPTLFLKEGENVFKSDTREFPIYFAYPFYDDYEIIIMLPQGYTIEKLPENVSFNLPDNMGSYEYTIEQTSTGIKLSIKEKINNAILPNTIYKELKDFYGKIVDKENEKVVLVKAQ